MEPALRPQTSAPRQVVRTVLHEALESKLGGEVVVRSTTVSGRIFVVARKVAWAVLNGPGALNFSSVLIREQVVSREDVEQVVAECRQSGGNFCETLVAWGLVPRDTMRDLLRRHMSEQLEALLSLTDAQAMFVPQPRTYSSQLTYGLDELISTAAKPPTHPLVESEVMANVKQSLEETLKIEGAFAACLADSKSGMCLGSIGGSPAFNIETAAAANTEVVRSKMKAMTMLGIKDRIEDILITLGEQYHLIRPLAGKEGLFLYVALHRSSANLAMARYKLSEVEKSLQV
ncbi:hypothetical protein MYMAC_000816 [Corallococcus macrosporus DSM 14697]|uniref:Roadblock/LAMTOR2 domain-containing protein n=1 Tax=Corallococcus macrosporus DSM 14697 TaxID=1189310 RepID=A0A250JPB5_9BACT|nr:hypothetical protein [Corallococcus macrosporus]ATB45231.1 hypothetical protein MYMAC_000816 [Corallococcus macrosporus DSM 14697]